MKYTHYILGAVLIAILAFSIGTGFSTYGIGYDNGYCKGYQEAQSHYPSMTLEGFSFSSGNTSDNMWSVSVSGITITGEQRILDMIQNMPEIVAITSNTTSYNVALKETGLSIISKSK